MKREKLRTGLYYSQEKKRGMYKKGILVIILSIVFSFSVFPGGEAESGRDSAISMVGADSYVASSYLDLDSILDDYYYPYEINQNESLSYNISVSNPSVLTIGGRVELQVSVKTNDYDYFPVTDFNYIIYINNSELLEDIKYRRAVRQSVRKIFALKPHNSHLFFYFKKDGIIKELTALTSLSSMIEGLENQYTFKLEEKSDDYDKKAKEDLSLLLEAAPQNGRPNKFFWIFNKAIAKSARDINDIFSIIAGLGDETTEISFCGFSDNFRAATVNSIVDQFGGNSYFFTDADDLMSIIEEDYRFYLQPAVSDLKISIHSLENKTEIDPVILLLLSSKYYGVELPPDSNFVKIIEVKSLGANEHHTYLTPFSISPKYSCTRSLNNNLVFKDSSVLLDSDIYPFAMVLIEYFDHKMDKYVYSSGIETILYTPDYEDQMETLDSYVNRNIHIRDTYLLISEISSLLRNGNYKDPLVKLNLQIEKLVYLNRKFNDDLISEDIEMLRKYKELIYENKEKPFRGFKAFSELSLKRY